MMIFFCLVLLVAALLYLACGLKKIPIGKLSPESVYRRADGQFWIKLDDSLQAPANLGSQEYDRSSDLPIKGNWEKAGDPEKFNPQEQVMVVYAGTANEQSSELARQTLG